jgi:hypothetical protein
MGYQPMILSLKEFDFETEGFRFWQVVPMGW